jgi:hypothetical protein
MTTMALRKLRKGPQAQVDLRVGYDEKRLVRGGVLYRKGHVIQVWWRVAGKETWTLPDTEAGIVEAMVQFRVMAERFCE